MKTAGIYPYRRSDSKDGELPRANELEHHALRNPKYAADLGDRKIALCPHALMIAHDLTRGGIYKKRNIPDISDFDIFPSTPSHPRPSLFSEAPLFSGAGRLYGLLA